MTQDELRAALLLLGFYTGTQKRYFHRFSEEQVITVTFGEHDVVVSYRTPANDPTDRHEFRAIPEIAFNYIKEKLA